MRGAVAAGHEITAQAGARALEEGGNAVDACIAAAFASWVAESPLTGPGAGGFMLVHRAHDRSRRLLDFFVAAPGQGRPARGDGEMDAVDIPFEGSVTTQRFLDRACLVRRAGHGRWARSGHRSYGTMPWKELVAPAVELAREGVVMTKAQALLHALLDSILGTRRRAGPCTGSERGSLQATGLSRPTSQARSRSSRPRDQTRSIAASSARRSQRTCRSTEARSRGAISRRTA